MPGPHLGTGSFQGHSSDREDIRSLCRDLHRVRCQPSGLLDYVEDHEGRRFGMTLWAVVCRESQSAARSPYMSCASGECGVDPHTRVEIGRYVELRGNPIARRGRVDLPIDSNV
jgi:hypothetical protein